MALLKACEKYFGTRDLYDVFDLPKTANAKDIKKAYHKLSLKTHPDKVDDERANQVFQTVSQIYSILSDDEKRKFYDETGNAEIEDQGNLQWKDYFSSIFPKVTVEDILRFKNSYKNSEEEKNDLKELYLKHKGNVDLISCCLMCYSVDDELRYKTIIDEMIKKKELPAYKAFLKGTSMRSHLKRKKNADREALECEELRKEMGLDGTCDSLAVALKKKNLEREGQFDDFLSNLEAKYCNPIKKGKRKK